MENHTLILAQLKGVLRQYALSATRREAELIFRLDETDPKGKWRDEVRDLEV